MPVNLRLWLKRFRFFVDLVWAAWLEYKHDRAKYFGLAMIYYAVVSLVPLFALLLSAIGLFLRFSPAAAEFRKQMMIGLEAHAGAQVPEAIAYLLETLQKQSIMGGLISLVGLVAASSVLFRHLRLSFRAIWKHDPPLVSGSLLTIVRTSMAEYVVSVLMVLGAGGLLTLGLVLTIAAEWMNRLAGGVLVLSQTVGWSFALLGAFVIEAIGFALLFKILPPVRVGWRHILPTALLCAVVWVAASEILALSASRLGDGAYGAIAGFLAILLWMNVLSQVLFFGAELCKVAVMRAGGFSTN